MRDRLIELLRNAKTDVPFYTSNGKLVTKIQRCIVDRYEAKELADYLIANGVIVPPCKEGDVIYRIVKFCEANTGYKEFFRPSIEFENDCPYLDPASWCDDSNTCTAITDYREADYCDINLKILCDACKNRIAIQKDRFTFSKMHQVFNTPMYDKNTDLYYTYFLTLDDVKEAEAKLKGR